MLRKDKPDGNDSRKDDAALAPTGQGRVDRFDDVDRWFDDLRRNFFRVGPIALLPDLIQDRFSLREPRLDLIDNGSEFLVRAELPGISKDDVDLTLTPDGLAIRAETEVRREEAETGYCYRERRHSAVHRTLPFPAQAVPERAVASLKDGLLEVRVPKREPTPETKPVKVRVD